MNKAGTPAEAIPYLKDVNGNVHIKTAMGTASLVSGTATIATGLATVSAIFFNIVGATGFATGATEVNDITIGSITTGSVVANGIFNSFATGAATLSVSGTSTFRWFAVGT